MITVTMKGAMEERERQMLPAIPGAFIGSEFELLVHFPRPQLIEAADEAGAAGAAVEPQHNGRLCQPADIVGGFVEHVEEPRLAFGADGQVPGARGDRLLWEVGIHFGPCKLGLLRTILWIGVGESLW